MLCITFPSVGLLMITTVAPAFVPPQPSYVPVKDTTQANPSREDTQPLQKPTAAVRVTLSGLGLEKAANERRSENRDIEESGLPDQAQKILRIIREIQQKIEEKQQELQAVLADQSIALEVKDARVNALQSELVSLSASLFAANNSLNKLTKNGKLSKSQTQLANQLLMSKLG